MHISETQYTLSQVVRKIESMGWDLETEFHRQEIWPIKKKQRLIDTILRGWQMHSIHLLESSKNGQKTVLDGHQRLSTIWEFMQGSFSVNGEIPPSSGATSSLHGLTYDQFPSWARREFSEYKILVVYVAEYTPGEVAELFYRLNQGNPLTAAEHRNAFHGPVSKQIKNIARDFANLSADDRTLGFSNVRLAYDDVLAHLASTLIEGSFSNRIKPSSITEMYSWELPLPMDIEFALKDAIHAVAPALRNRDRNIKFGKASIYSWLLFSVRAQSWKIMPQESISDFILDFESARQNFPNSIKNHFLYDIFSRPQFSNLLDIFSKRCSSRISESSSVVLRDLVIWIFFVLVSKHPRRWGKQPEFLDSVEQIVDILNQYKFVSEDVLLDAATALGWGKKI